MAARIAALSFEEALRALEDVVRRLESGEVPLFFYETGSWGPYEATKFLGESRSWRGHCGDFDEA